jgi:hypothetical protein
MRHISRTSRLTAVTTAGPSKPRSFPATRSQPYASTNCAATCGFMTWYTIELAKVRGAGGVAMARQMSSWIGDFIVNLLFGRQVNDDDEAQKSPTWRYQKRQNKLVVVGGLLVLGFASFCVWGASSQSVRLGITVSFAFMVALNVWALSAASDAIFDSLFERINLQSAWLHARLTEIESNTSKDGRLRGQRRWEKYGSEDDDAHYYTCPERYTGTGAAPEEAG